MVLKANEFPAFGAYVFRTIRMKEKLQTTNYQPRATRQHIFIIAEAGVNHNGSIDTAKKMVDVAAEAGADAIKFQTFKAEKVVACNAPKAEYQEAGTGKKESQLEMVRKLELDEASHNRLIEHCGEKGIQFLSTPFDLESVDLLLHFGLSVFIIPSGEITNLPEPCEAFHAHAARGRSGWFMGKA
jgi:sialic acid synthase SpsE